MNNDDQYKYIFDSRGHRYNSATATCPLARENELNALLKLFIARPSLSPACDIPAGGGYVAESLKKIIDPSIPIVCVEPSLVFSAAIPEEFKVISSPVDNIPTPDNYFSTIFSLAGLHHASNLETIFNEWHRVIEPGGQVIVADVATKTGAAKFLNGFLDRHNPQGHKGFFFENGSFPDLLQSSGFKIHFNKLIDVPWVFDSTKQMAQFCYSLFGMENIEEKEIIKELETTIGISSNGNKILLHWQLQYAAGFKPLE